MRSGAALVPDYAMQRAQEQAMELQQKQYQLASNIENQKQFNLQREQAREDQYNMDVEAYMANPTPDGLINLMAKYPKQSEGIKRAHEAKSADAQQTDFRTMTDVYAYAQAGDWQRAGDLVTRQIDADRAAGREPDQEDLYVQSLLSSGDPAKQRQAVGILSIGLAGIAGPEKFAATFGALNPELKVVTVEQGGQGGVIDPLTGKYTPLFISGNPPAGGSAPQSGGGGQYLPPRNNGAQTVNDLPKDAATGAFLISGDADWRLLAKGMRFIAPDGTMRVK